MSTSAIPQAEEQEPSSQTTESSPAAGAEAEAAPTDETGLEREIGAMFDAPAFGAASLFQSDKPAAEKPTEEPAAVGAPVAETPAAEVTYTPEEIEAARVKALEGAEPFKVGEQAIEGVYSVPGQGLMVLETDRPKFEQFVTQATENARKVEEYQQQNGVYDRLSEYATFDKDGKVEKTYQGADGLVEMRVNLVRNAEIGRVLGAAIADPVKLLSLITGSGPDGKTPVLVPGAVQSLLTEARLAAVEAEHAVRHALAQRRGAVGPVAGAVGDQSAAISKVAPQVVDASIKAFGTDGAKLTAQDKAFLSQQLPRYVRTTTAADVAANHQLKLNAPLVDASFMEVVKDRIAMRLELAKTVTTATKAATDNAATLAAAANGARGPAKSATTTKTRQPTPEESRAQDAEDAWDMRERMAAGRLRGNQ